MVNYIVVFHDKNEKCISGGVQECLKFKSVVSHLSPQARGDGERRSLMATNEQQGKKMLFDFTDPKIFGEEEAASWWESSDTVR